MLAHGFSNSFRASGRHLRHQQQASRRSIAGDLKGLVWADAEALALEPFQDSLVRRHARHPVLITPAAAAFGAGCNKDDGAALAGDPGSVPKRLLRLVHVDVLRMPREKR